MNGYSVPVEAGITVQVKVLPAAIEVWQDGACVARHERGYERGQHILNLEHYLEVLERKPGALAGSTPLAQWREQRRCPASFDRLGQELMRRQRKAKGTRQMIRLLPLGKVQGYEKLPTAAESALAWGCGDEAQEPLFPREEPRRKREKATPRMHNLGRAKSDDQKGPTQVDKTRAALQRRAAPAFPGSP
ncbi:MAG: hypothetical protein ABSA59_17220 [Terriglobia bacterium]